MPMEDLFRLARTSTVAQLLERDDFSKRYSAGRADLDPRAALPADAGLRLGRRCAPTSSSAAPTRSSTCCSRATSSRPTASTRRWRSRCRSCPAPTASGRCRSRYGNYVGVAEPPEEIFGKLMRVPGRGDAGLLPAADGRAVRPGPAGGRVQAPPGPDAGRALPRGRRRHAPPRSTSTACTSSRPCPDEIEEALLPADDPVFLPVAAGRRVRRLALRGAAPARAAAGCESTASRWPPRSSRCRPTGWTAPWSRSASGGSSASAGVPRTVRLRPPGGRPSEPGATLRGPARRGPPSQLDPIAGALR